MVNPPGPKMIAFRAEHGATGFGSQASACAGFVATRNAADGLDVRQTDATARR
jgi:hypothetical protein